MNSIITGCHYALVLIHCWQVITQLMFTVMFVGKHDLNSIIGLVSEAFRKRAMRIENIYIILCDSRLLGVVDTSLGHYCLE